MLLTLISLPRFAWDAWVARIPYKKKVVFRLGTKCSSDYTSPMVPFDKVIFPKMTTFQQVESLLPAAPPKRNFISHAMSWVVEILALLLHIIWSQQLSVRYPPPCVVIKIIIGLEFRAFLKNREKPTWTKCLTFLKIWRSDSKILTNFNFKSSTPRPQRFAGAGREGCPVMQVVIRKTPLGIPGVIRDDLFRRMLQKTFKCFLVLSFLSLWNVHSGKLT